MHQAEYIAVHNSHCCTVYNSLRTASINEQQISYVSILSTTKASI